MRISDWSSDVCSSDLQHNRAQVLLDDGYITEKVTQSHQATHPLHRARNIEKLKTQNIHAANPGNERRKGTKNRQKTGQNDGLATVLFIEGVRFDQRISIQKAGIAGKHLGADIPAYGIIDRVAQHGCHDQYARQHDRIQQTRCAERAGNEQQRIAGQKWQHHQTGFAKNNKKQHQVNPFAILRYPVAQELVYMENHVKQIKHIHYRKKLSQYSPISAAAKEQLPPTS